MARTLPSWDGQNFTKLPYVPDGVLRGEATTSNRSTRDAKVAVNQEAIFAKLLGENLSTLPFLPDDTIRSDAMLGNRTTRDAIIIINQEAIFGKLPT